MKKFLVVARKENIRLVSLDVDKNIDFRLNIDKQYTRNVHDVVYDVELQRVYWTDSGCTGKPSVDDIEDCSRPGGINSIFLNGTGKTRISLCRFCKKIFHRNFLFFLYSYMNTSVIHEIEFYLPSSIH